MKTAHPKVALGVPIRSERRVAIFSGLAFLSAPAWLVAGGLTDAHRAGQEPVAAFVMNVMFLAFALIGIWVGNRIRHASLSVSDGAVVVQNPFRRDTVPLETVDSFRAGNATPNGTNGTPGIVLVLRDGRSLPVWALAAESSIWSMKKKTASFSPLASELNSLLASARDVVPSGSQDASTEGRLDRYGRAVGPNPAR